MKLITSKIDTSAELLVQRWQSGVKLIRPEAVRKHKTTENCSYPSINNLFQLPINIYFLNTESVIQNMSDATAAICGFQSKKDAIGNTVRTVSKKESADFSIGHNNEVLMTKSIVIKDECFLRFDDFKFCDIAIKFPLFDESEKLIGVFGCSIILEQAARCSLAESFHLLMQTDLLTSQNIANKTNNTISNALIADDNQYDDIIEDLHTNLSAKTHQKFSKRETECLYHLINGKSAIETGSKLNLSRRTIEWHLDSLKEKLGCRKKTDIINNVTRLFKK